MARGKLLRTKVKAEKALTKAALQAKKEWEQRKSNFTYLTKKWITEHADLETGMKLTAVLGITLLVKSSIDWVQAKKQEPAIFFFGIPTTPGAFGKMLAEIIPESEAAEWAISFGIAYVLVEHFGAVIQTASNIPHIVSTLFMLPILG